MIQDKSNNFIENTYGTTIYQALLNRLPKRLVPLDASEMTDKCHCGKHHEIYMKNGNISHNTRHIMMLWNEKIRLAVPYAEYEAKTMMCAEALLIEYQKGLVLCDALYGTW